MPVRLADDAPCAAASDGLAHLFASGYADAHAGLTAFEAVDDEYRRNVAFALVVRAPEFIIVLDVCIFLFHKHHAPCGGEKRSAKESLLKKKTTS